MNEDKEKRIKAEKSKLTRIFKDLEEKKKKTVQRVIDNMAFMAVTLEDLQKTINEQGVLSEYQNGENQFGTKKSPEVEIYNTMVKNYATIIRQLTDLLPKDEVKADDGFGDFINAR